VYRPRYIPDEREGLPYAEGGDAGGLKDGVEGDERDRAAGILYSAVVEDERDEKGDARLAEAEEDGAKGESATVGFDVGLLEAIKLFDDVVLATEGRDGLQGANLRIDVSE
jgi:hypothetical protein